MNIAVGADHAGYSLKSYVVQILRERGHEVLDLGTDSADHAVDYPDFALAVSKAVVEGVATRGIIVCGSGVGACIAANKVPGIYAGLCHDTYSAHQGVEHDDMNVLCLGSRVVGLALAEEIVRAFVGARFERDVERHVRRHSKVREIEKAGLNARLD